MGHALTPAVVISRVAASLGRVYDRPVTRCYMIHANPRPDSPQALEQQALESGLRLAPGSDRMQAMWNQPRGPTRKCHATGLTWLRYC